MSAGDILQARLTREEGERFQPYDDATGKPVKAPVGNLTWGRGFNLMVCGSSGLFDAMERYLLDALDTQLLNYEWYKNAGDVRASVFLDIAYNGGLHDLLGYPSMIHFASIGDWDNAAAQCTDKDPKLDNSRYKLLRQILVTGVS